MLQVEAKVRDNDYDIAVAELRDKMANWTPGLHGTREYMLCCAAAGKRLRFFAVMRGGVDWRAVSREFDRTLPLDRLEVRGRQRTGSDCGMCEHHLVQVAARITLYTVMRDAE